MSRKCSASGKDAVNHKLSSVFLRLLVFFVLPVNLAIAETASESFSCVLGDKGRVVELVYLQQPQAVPCEIREALYDGEQRVLWRAEFDVSFCQNQFLSYREKLNSFGWPCSEVESLLPGNQLSTTTLDNDLVKAVNAQSNTNGSIKSDELLQLPEQVFLVQNESADISSTQRVRPRLDISDEPLTAADIRDLDGWLIYLSAQSMAAIRKAVPDSTFDEYLRDEKFSANTIYLRLQKRIEFLNTVLSEQ